MTKNRLRQLRKERGLSQVAVQMRINIDQTVLSKYELGSRSIPVDNLMLLADFYGTSMDYIMLRTDVRQPYPPAGEG